MNEDAGSLSNLQDIVIPAPPSLWPFAPELWFVVTVFTVVVLLILWHWILAWKTNAYRRAGSALLTESTTVRDVSIVLKRVALAAFPREDVASLYGKDWTRFLSDTGTQEDLSEIDTSDSSTPATRELIDRASSWIRHHRISELHSERSRP